MAFEDTQAAIYLLRVSYSSVRRTTPLSHWHSIATSFDSSVRRAFESIVGFPLSQTAYAQACLTPKLGGFGIRRVTQHAEGAFNACRFVPLGVPVWVGPRPRPPPLHNKRPLFLWTPRSFPFWFLRPPPPVKNNVFPALASPMLALGLPLSPLPLMGLIVLSVLWPSGLLAAFVLACRFVLVGSPALVACTQI